MTAITDAEVEAVARVMCAACNRDPDAPIPGDHGANPPMWHAFHRDALVSIAAHRAIEALKPQAGGPVTVWCDYGEGWEPSEYPTLKEALLADHGTAQIRITRNVDFEPVEKGP